MGYYLTGDERDQDSCHCGPFVPKRGTASHQDWSKDEQSPRPKLKCVACDIELPDKTKWAQHLRELQSELHNFDTHLCLTCLANGIAWAAKQARATNATTPERTSSTG